MYENVIFWGTGNIASKFIDNHKSFIKKINVVGFTDNDKNKWGTFFYDYIITKPSDILKNKFDYIIVLSSYIEEIKRNIEVDYSVPLKQVLSINEAFELFLKKRFQASNEKEFGFPELLEDLSFSEQIYRESLKNMNAIFSYMYLKEHYLPYISEMISENYDFTDKNKSEVPKKDFNIWICWLQGMENAPDIVKCCVNSVITNAIGKIHIITYDNYSDFVNINKVFIEKHQQGYISQIHFSDILRIALLYKYGGVWLDATVLLMDTGLPEYIYQTPLFMYKVWHTIDHGVNDPRMFSNWLIAAQKGNSLMGMLYAIMEKYWTAENECPYFLFHYFVRMLWDKYQNKDKNKMILYQDRCVTLRELLNETYDATIWNILRNTQPLQKLSYKKRLLADDTTFFSYIKHKYGAGVYSLS